MNTVPAMHSFLCLGWGASPTTGSLKRQAAGWGQAWWRLGKPTPAREQYAKELGKKAHTHVPITLVPQNPLGVLFSSPSHPPQTAGNHFPDSFLHSFTAYVWSLKNILCSFEKVSSQHKPSCKEGATWSSRQKSQEKVKQGRVSASEAGFSFHECLPGHSKAVGGQSHKGGSGYKGSGQWNIQQMLWYRPVQLLGKGYMAGVFVLF